MEDSNKKNYFLKKEIVISATDGNRTIPEQRDVFFSIDSNFEKFGLNKKSKSTKGCRVEFYEFKKIKTLRQLFEDLKVDLNKSCFTQDQILEVVKNIGDFESDCFGKLFLVKKLKMIALLPFIFFVNLFMTKKIEYYNYFVINIFSYMTGLRSEVYSINDKSVSWGGGCFPCVAIPVFENEYLFSSSKIIKIDKTEFVCQKLKKNGTYRNIFEGFDRPFKDIFLIKEEIDFIIKGEDRPEHYKRILFLSRKIKPFLYLPFIFILNLFFWKKRISYYKYFPATCHFSRHNVCLEETVFDHDSGWSPNFDTEIITKK